VIQVGSGIGYVVVDQFADRNKVSGGLSVRRFVLKEQRAADLTGKL
jgi:hypothetical protein